MRVVVQRSKNSTVSVEEKIIASIDEGLALLIGFTEEDNKETLKWMAKKIVNLRIFPDKEGVMNCSLLESGGKVLAVSQFTLYADATKGNRPSYMRALKSEEARKLYDEFCLELEKYVEVERGQFGADMTVSITNLGPTTILLER